MERTAGTGRDSRSVTITTKLKRRDRNQTPGR